MVFKFGFGKSSQKEEEQKEVSPIENRRLYPADRNPFYGTNFRTCAIRLENGGDSYMKAFKKPDGGWKVLEVFETDANSPDGEPGIVQQIKQDGIDFFTAVDALAQFETAKRFHYPEAENGQKAVLGFEHYQAFAEREGIAFDKNGLPHETQDGEIVTEGDFAKSAIESFRKNHLAPQKRLQAIFAEVNFNTDAAAGVLMPALDSRPDQLKTVFGILKEGEKQVKFLTDNMLRINIFADTLKSVREAWIDGLYQGFASKDLARDYLDGTGSLKKKNFYSKAMERITQAEQSLNGLAEVVEVAPIMQGLEVCRFSLTLQYAGELAHAAMHGPFDNPVSFYEEKTAQLKTVCLDSMRRLGVPNAHEKYIDALILKEAHRPEPQWVDVEPDSWSANRFAFISNPAGMEFARGWQEPVRINTRASSIPGPVAEFFNKCAPLPAQALTLVQEAEHNARSEALKVATEFKMLPDRAPSAPGPV